MTECNSMFWCRKHRTLHQCQLEQGHSDLHCFQTVAWKPEQDYAVCEDKCCELYPQCTHHLEWYQKKGD